MQKILRIVNSILSVSNNIYKEAFNESIGIIANRIFTDYVLLRGEIVRNKIKKNFIRIVYKYIR